MAWMEFGALVGFPPRQYGALVFKKGPEEWRKTIEKATPTVLGMAWQEAEAKTRYHVHLKQEHQKEKAKETSTVPVLQYTEGGSALEPGYYSARIDAIEEVSGEFGLQLKFHFALLDQDGEPVTKKDGSPVIQWGWCSMKWGPKTKLFEWARAILRTKTPKEGEPLDTDDLLNRKVDFQMGENQKGNVALLKLYPYRSMTGSDDD